MVNFPIWQHREDGWIVKGIVTMLMVMTVVQNTKADLDTLLQLTATSVIERPERAALEPPTVTSLKPPNRSKDVHGSGGIPVQSEQSGSHIPPVVASRSPSSSSFSRNYNSRYHHLNPPLYQPSAPVATASSSSRSGHRQGIGVEHVSSKTHHTVPAPSPNLVNGTSVSIPQESLWVSPVSYAPPPPRHSHISSSSVATSYPRDPRVQANRGQEHILPNGGEGFWGETEGNSDGGLWKKTERQPSYHRSYGHSISEDTSRTDTFGHHISEDLSHLSSIYTPRRGSSSGSHVPVPRNDHHLGEANHGINNDNYHLNDGFKDAIQPDDHTGERTTTAISRNSKPELSQKFGLAPTAYGSGIHNDQMHKSQVIPEGGSEIARGPLTLYEILHMVNMSSLDNFAEFLKRKGLKFSHVLHYLNEGASKQAFLEYFDKPDLITHESSKAAKVESDVLHSESFLHEVTDHEPDFSSTIFTSEELHEKLNGEDDNSEEINQNKKRRKGKNKKKRRRNKGKNRNRDRNHNNKQTVMDIAYTTETATSYSPTTPFFTTTPQMTSEQSMRKVSVTPVMTLNSTKPAITKSLSEINLVSEAPRPVSVSVPPLLTLWSQSSLDSSTTHTFLANATATTRETPVLASDISPSDNSLEISKLPKTTSLPKSQGSKTGSLTLPPTSKPSEVSIISFTVMEVPMKNAPKETFLEDVMPLREKILKPVETYPKRVYSSPKLFPSVIPRKMNDDPMVRTPYKREDSKESYTFPVKGFMIITGIMGALAVFTLVVLISYAIIKCSKQPVVNNYQVSEQKQATQQ